MNNNDISRYQRALEAGERRRKDGQRRTGGNLLGFDSSIEMDYLDHRRREGLPLLRFGLVLSLVFYVSFLVADALLWGRYQLVWILVPTAVSCAANLAVLALTWKPRWLRLLDVFSAGAVLVNAFSLAFASAYGFKVGVPIPPEAPILQQVYILFLLNLPFRLAAPVAATAVGIFVLMHSMSGMENSAYFYRCFMMVAAGVLGTVACYLTERTQRLAWLRSRLLRELSEHDSLTGLYNHRLFYQRGDQLLRQSRRDRCGVAVLLADVDHFKRFNDSHGHLAGDEALRVVATALSHCARRPLDLAARLGGEEFGLLLYHLTPESAELRAEELRNSVRGLALAGDRRVTVSIGIAYAESSKVTTVEALVGAADSALYRAKTGGRDRVSK